MNIEGERNAFSSMQSLENCRRKIIGPFVYKKLEKVVQRGWNKGRIQCSLSGWEGI